jgi:hypothetical protein
MRQITSKKELFLSDIEKYDGVMMSNEEVLLMRSCIQSFFD